MKAASVLLILSACLIVESWCGLVRQPFECQPGTPYVENECNSCFCLGDNDLVCSLKQCPDNKDKGLERCATGTMWQKDCNTCWCVNMGTVCTDHKCTAYVS